MRLEGSVVGVRLWPLSKGSRRSISIDWEVKDGNTDVRSFESMQVTDNENELSVGDKVVIDIIKIE